MRPYLHKTFFYSKALSYVRFYEDAGLLIAGFRNGTALRYVEATLADFQRLSHARAPGKVMREWLNERQTKKLPKGITMSAGEVMRSSQEGLPAVGELVEDLTSARAAAG